ncbi:MAG TPA: ribosomal protein S18-alanine N-acetyltransferase [Candidatus Limiplasma sp.]|nr:ribosomal protein S18-alanine N-acetyltransferase [Candidatus Limiplasma sp.]
MTDADVKAVHAIEQHTFSMPWPEESFHHEMLENPAARYLVAVDDEGTVIAYAGAWIIFEESHITNIAVDQAYRGQGIGETLTRALIQYAANLGVDYMTLEVRRSNLVAQGMYEKLGFIKLGVRKRYYTDNQEDALLMVLQTMPEIEEDFSE